jgi:hypothetical protein
MDKLEMTRSTELKLSLSIVLTVLMITAGVVGAHFMGIAAVEAQSKKYTDDRVDDLRKELSNRLKEIHNQTIDNGKAVVRIETKIGR